MVTRFRPLFALVEILTDTEFAGNNKLAIITIRVHFVLGNILIEFSGFFQLLIFLLHIFHDVFAQRIMRDRIIAVLHSKVVIPGIGRFLCFIEQFQRAMVICFTKQRTDLFLFFLQRLGKLVVPAFAAKNFIGLKRKINTFPVIIVLIFDGSHLEIFIDLLDPFVFCNHRFSNNAVRNDRRCRGCRRGRCRRFRISSGCDRKLCRDLGRSGIFFLQCCNIIIRSD